MYEILGETLSTACTLALLFVVLPAWVVRRAYRRRSEGRAYRLSSRAFRIGGWFAGIAFALAVLFNTIVETEEGARPDVSVASSDERARGSGGARG